MPRGERQRQGGAVMLALLLVTLSVALAATWVVEQWSRQLQREREAELLRLGVAYANAIARYRAASPGDTQQGPVKVEDLLEDPRFARPTRHLRSLRPDPVSGGAWEWVRDRQGALKGVRSTSLARPLRRVDFRQGAVKLPPADRYADWLFEVPAEPPPRK